MEFRGFLLLAGLIAGVTA